MQKSWYQQTEAEVCAFFDVDSRTGLSQKDALKRLAHFGKNADDTVPSGLEKELLVRVIREGKKQYIPFFQLVPGDIVSVEQGDRVPADIRLILVNSLRVNQGALTGEATAALKNTFAVQGDAVQPVNQKCMLFAGSYIETGTGVGVVVERGIQTYQYRIGKKKRKQTGIKGSVIARRLRRFGLVVLRKQSLTNFRRITHVIIEDNLSDGDITDIVRKVQLTRNIQCRFAVSEIQAKRLSLEMNAETYDASSRSGQLRSALFITNLHTDTDNSLHIMKELAVKDATFMWVSDGKNKSLAMNLATISLVVGRVARADVIMAADLFAPRQNSTILTRILYNKK